MKSLLTSLALLSICSFSHAQTTYYVPDDFSTIQLAIDGSLAGDTVIVRDGTYYENIDFDNNIHLKSENGFVTTIIDGSMPSGSQPQVVTFGDVDNTAKLQGFTITGGSNSNWNGGGLYIARSGSTPSPTIEDCKISNNSAGIRGGGIWVGDDCSPEFINCTISDNTAKWGAGMACWGGSSVALTNCTFTDNSATGSEGDGGGLHIYEASTASLDNCLFINNGSQRWGGGILCGDSSTLTLSDCAMTSNTAGADGGGIFMEETSVLDASNCTFTGNNSGSNGGGIFMEEISNATIENCVFENNKSVNGGGALYCWSFVTLVLSECVFINNETNYGGALYALDNSNSSTSITAYNCIFNLNESQEGGSAVFVDTGASVNIEHCTVAYNTCAINSEGSVQAYSSGEINITNSIIYGTTVSGVDLHAANGNLVSVTFSDVGTTSATGAFNVYTDNINADPLFVNPANNDFGLQFSSPCVDAGDPNSPLDPDGTRADMGAIPFYNGDSDNDGLSDSGEIAYGTDPLDQDTDDDGLSDGEEVYSFFTDPLVVDTDSDGIQDGTEVGNDTWWLGEPWNGIDGTDTSINIPDADTSTTTDPLDDDTDNDGLMDGQEDANHDGQFLGIELDPNDFDCDNDGLGDGLELGLAVPNGNDTDMTVFVADADPSTTTRATLRDTDGGGISDGVEDANRNGMIDLGEIDPRDSSDDTVYLTHNGASVGGQTTLNVYACEPGSIMVLCYSLAGPGPTVFANVTLDLSQPIRQLPIIHIDSNGNGALGPLPVPASVSVGDQAWFQGVQVSIFGSASSFTPTNMTLLTIQ